MPKNLRQAVEIPLGDKTASVDVSFRILEIVERVYDLRADFIKIVLQSERLIKRSDIARVVIGWLEASRAEFDREETLEIIMTAPESDIRKYVGAIQGAIMYSLRECTEEELEALARGEDIRTDEDEEGGGKKNEEPAQAD